MPDPTGVQHDIPGHDAEPPAQPGAASIGLPVLDAVYVGGTWTVLGASQPTPIAEAPGRRRRRLLLAWPRRLAPSALALGALTLVLALGVTEVVSGPGPTVIRVPASIAPGTVAQPVITTAPDPMPIVKPSLPVLVTPTAVPPTPTDTPSPTPTPSDTPTPTPTPAPTPTVAVTPIGPPPTIVPVTRP